MEQLPYIDTHRIAVAADRESTWRALVRVVQESLGGTGGSPFGRALRPDPPRASGTWSPDLERGAALPGFAVAEVNRGRLLSLRGGHRFSHYRLDFEVTPDESGRSCVYARTWAEFPGLAGTAYRTLVIRSGGHAVAVRRMLRHIATAATN